MTTQPTKPKQAELTDKAPPATSLPRDPATSTAIAAHPSNAAQKQSPVLALALQLNFQNAESFARVLKATIMPGNTSDEQVAMLCSVALAHNLNPLKREIYAFPDRQGIRPIISIDGWYTIANTDPMFDGITFEFRGAIDNANKQKSTLSCVCTIHRKDRAHPIVVEEFLDECFRSTEPWKGNTRRMLRHRAAIQAIRVAFGLAGVMDEEDYERMVEYEKLEKDRQTHGPARTADATVAALQAQRAARINPQATSVQGSAAQAATEPEDVPFTVKDEAPEPRDEVPPDVALPPDPAQDFPEYPPDAIDTTTRG